MGSGSGLMSKVPLDRGDQCGHFDTGFVVAVAVLSEIWRLENMWKNGKH
jgi:hypothetical protein